MRYRKHNFLAASTENCDYSDGLLVETHDFTDPTRPPEYYVPWKARIQPRLAEIKGKEYLMNGSLHQKAAIFNQNGFILLDLAKLP